MTGSCGTAEQRRAAADMWTMGDLLVGYPVAVETPVAWGEMDTFGHVNNIVYFRYFENARLDYFERIGYLTLMEETGAGPILASTSCRFRYPVQYPDTVYVAARVVKMEADRFVMEYRVVSREARTVAAEGEALVVSYDYRAEKKIPIPEVIRARIEDMEERGIGVHP